MKKQRGICVEIDGIFYVSYRSAGRVIKSSKTTIKNRCLSDNWSNYKIVPYRITYTEKECTQCGEVKLLKEFNKQAASKDGFNSECKECNNERYKKYKANNPDYWLRRYRDNKEYLNKLSRKNLKEKRKNDVSYRVSKYISNAVYKSLKGKKNGAHWEDIVGWTVKEGRAHLESLFTEGMTWENYGGGKYEWSLDHIIAVSKWDITSAKCQELKDCWALDNLQPLWHVRNMEKGNKPMEPKYLIKPF